MSFLVAKVFANIVGNSSNEHQTLYPLGRDKSSTFSKLTHTTPASTNFSNSTIRDLFMSIHFYWAHTLNVRHNDRAVLHRWATASANETNKRVMSAHHNVCNVCALNFKWKTVMISLILLPARGPFEHRCHTQTLSRERAHMPFTVHTHKLESGMRHSLLHSITYCSAIYIFISRFVWCSVWKCCVITAHCRWWVFGAYHTIQPIWCTIFYNITYHYFILRWFNRQRRTSLHEWWWRRVTGCRL